MGIEDIGESAYYIDSEFYDNKVKAPTPDEEWEKEFEYLDDEEEDVL